MPRRLHADSRCHLLDNNDDGQLPADFAGVRWYGSWKSKVSHGLIEAEELLSSPAQSAARPKPRNESLCELIGKENAKEAPDAMSPWAAEKSGWQP